MPKDMEPDVPGKDSDEGEGIPKADKPPNLSSIEDASEAVKAPCLSINKDTCRGLVPCVPWVTDYGPKFWIQPVPSSSKRLENYTLYTRYDPITPS
jgi:hypothetical protein